MDSNFWDVSSVPFITIISDEHDDNSSRPLWPTYTLPQGGTQQSSSNATNQTSDRPKCYDPGVTVSWSLIQIWIHPP